MRIVPAILEKNIEAFWQEITRLSPYFSTFQIDIADGKLVPNTTVQIEDILKGVTRYPPASPKLSFGGRDTLHVTRKSFDFHLMVEDYDADIEKLDGLKDTMKIGNVLVHLGAFSKDVIPSEVEGSSPKGAINNASTGTGLYLSSLDSSVVPLLQNDHGWEYGLVLNPEDTISDNWQLITDYRIVQLMTVNPGFQGAPFLPEQLNKIDELRNRGYTGKILLDGGINENTIPQIVSRKNPPDVLGIGSYITRAQDLEARVKELKSLVKHAEF